MNTILEAKQYRIFRLYYLFLPINVRIEGMTVTDDSNTHIGAESPLTARLFSLLAYSSHLIFFL